ncbi:alpha/beta hydrolase [Candidatus Enterococcus ferrettii]|uniref:Alpha/beta hydrolase fold-3 domain-containing protein n=1 Tax=Candidatus Enterococcus ferrettii TaxID=2815324 RepID=A0ABV0EUS5_9ENTE|nr:alpha/beta hydrolase [Enterococcus sp. 665A]MBO1339253.1 alpha/beta hydrolase [Enterococcus sp. 665A]
MKSQHFVYRRLGDLVLEMTFYPQQAESTRETTILYFHGGGFLFGQRDDLTYINQLMENGMNVLTIDYPLAPETALTEIVSCLEDAVDWFLTHFEDELQLRTSNFFLFGRSAGGYLASILTTNRYKEQLGLIRFYGYHDFKHACFTLPSPFYGRYPKVPPMDAQKIISKGNSEERFLLYLSARQYGNWLSYLGSMTEKLVVEEEQLKEFPPTFCVHCSQDPDVPVEASRQLAKSTVSSTYIEIAADVHDFDREQNPQSDDVYERLITWLKKHN